MEAIERRSTKEKVIEIAQSDPFLSIETIAQSAGTTARYVRTILSEADLSLTAMRKNYARNLERRLGQELAARDFPVEKDLQIKRVKARDYSHLMDFSGKKELFQISHFSREKGLESYIQILTAEEVTLGSEYSGLRELLSGPGRQLRVGRQWAEVVSAGFQLAEAFGLARGAQLLRLSTILHKEEKPVALELRWFALEGLVLQWPAQKGEVQVTLTG
ncbi:MAG: hypothetical protein GX335_03575 [Firmicutes bacterium]|nr:hypothetical protein [Bacillota bacterium]